MTHYIRLNELDSIITELDYPVSRDVVVRHGDSVTLRLADGTKNLGELISESNEDTYTSEDDLFNEIFSLLPRRAVGEPFQSEGDA